MIALDFLISIDDLANQIADDLSNHKIVEFVKAVDIVATDWDVTRQLRDYFVEQMNIFEQNEGE